MEPNSTGTVFGLILTTLVRYVIVAVCAWLVQHQVISEGDTALFRDPVTIAAIVGGLSTLLLAVYIRLKSKFKMNTALKMPVNSTHEELNTVTQQSSIGQIMSTNAATDSVIRAATK